MLKYAKIANKETGIVEVGIGDPEAVWKTETIVIEPPSEENPEGKTETQTLYVSDFYKSLGMNLMDVEQGHDGQWYLAGYAPVPPPPPETKTVRTFSKFSIWVATHEMPLTLEDGTQTTVWAAFEAFLNNAGLWTGWLQLVDLVEDNPFFEAFYPQAVDAFGKELVDGVLAASVTSTKEVII